MSGKRGLTMYFQKDRVEEAKNTNKMILSKLMMQNDKSN